MKLLDVQNVSKVFRIGSILRGSRLVAVDDVSFSIAEDKPSILTVVGESGCGKTTLAKMILRIYSMTEGDIKINGRSVASKKEYPVEEFKREVQPIFQNPFETFSSRKTVDSYLYNTALNLDVVSDRAEASRLIDERLKSVGLSLDVVKGKYPAQFSGGELQRCSIARALIPSPKMIIADEPVAAIDASMKMNIVNLFKKLKDEYDVTFVYITHDLSTAYYVSDYVATLYRGNLVEYGTAQAVLDTPAHPYTHLLLNSVPVVGDKWDEEEVEDADEERKSYQLEGCKFAPRCPRATQKCFDQRPDYTYIDHETGQHTKTAPTGKYSEAAHRVLCYYPLAEGEKP